MAASSPQIPCRNRSPHYRRFSRRGFGRVSLRTRRPKAGFSREKCGEVPPGTSTELSDCGVRTCMARTLTSLAIRRLRHGPHRIWRIILIDWSIEVLPLLVFKFVLNVCSLSFSWTSIFCIQLSCSKNSLIATYRGWRVDINLYLMTLLFFETTKNVSPI